jgi:hypothetical protein
MDKKDVIEHFGSQANTARALGIKRQAVNKWPDLIPILQAIEVERVSGGKLKVDHSRYRKGHVRTTHDSADPSPAPCA